MRKLKIIIIRKSDGYEFNLIDSTNKSNYDFRKELEQVYPFPGHSITLEEIKI